MQRSRFQDDFENLSLTTMTCSYFSVLVETNLVVKRTINVSFIMQHNELYDTPVPHGRAARFLLRDGAAFTSVKRSTDPRCAVHGNRADDVE